MTADLDTHSTLSQQLAIGRIDAKALGKVAVLFGGDFYGIGEHYEIMNETPNKGHAPIPFHVAAQPDNVVVATVSLPRALVQDGIAVIARKSGF